MSKQWIIIRKEFLTRVKRKSFLVTTLLTPVFTIVIALVPFFLAQIEDPDIKTVGVVDATGLYMSEFESTEQFNFVECGNQGDAFYAYVVISDTLSRNPNALKIVSKDEVSPALQNYVRRLINRRIYYDKLLEYDIPELQDILNDLNKKVAVATVKTDGKGGEQVSNNETSQICGLLSALFVFMFLMSYGSMVMNSVLEEKTSRIVEIMVSSVKPFQLMLGKIVGIFFVGMLQFAVWGIIYSALGCTGLMGLRMSGVSSMMEAGVGDVVSKMDAFDDMFAALSVMPWGEMFIIFVLYFFGGYLLFASLLAAIGSSVNSSEEAHQFMVPFTLILSFGLYGLLYSFGNPNGPLSFWLSFFPFTSPMAMMSRVANGVPLWQELVSLLILYLSAFGMLWLGAKIYRVGILMYGKKPSIKEILKWVKYK